MIGLLRLLSRFLELILAIPLGVARFVVDRIAFNPRLGPFRHLLTASILYVLFAFALVYLIAPARGLIGHYFIGESLNYDAERWVATAIYDARGNFAGTFDPRLDSRRDVNYTDAPIDLGDYTANPDHKSIPVREVPPHYWECLRYHEDRYIGTWLNPYGIDLPGVLRIPYTTIVRSIASRHFSLGVGGSTLPMQFARVIYKTPPSASESGFTKLSRKLREWWLAPVIYFELTKGGDDTPLKQWAANHIWLAQRTGGQPLHGVEVTSQIVFGKEAKDLTIAEQYVLASAVNKPIILLEGSDRLNAVRLDRWKYIAEVRARTCAEKLLHDEAEQKKVVFDLIALAGGPPDPKIKPRLLAALEEYAPTQAKRAEANPVIRANALMPSARFGLREEMKGIYGFAWRDYVRGLTTSFDAAENLAFDERIKSELTKLDVGLTGKLNPGYTLDQGKTGELRLADARVTNDGAGVKPLPVTTPANLKSPDVIVVAANWKGEIVRYYESGETAAYFGSPSARNPLNGFYEPEREGRMLASTAKMLAAIAIANEGKDGPDSIYLDTNAPLTGLDGCAHGGGQRRGRRALTAFACSLNAPLMNRLVILGQDRVKRLIDGFGFNMPATNADGEGTPPSTAVVLGQIGGSPRRVHQMAGVVLNALIDKGGSPVRPPSLVKSYDYTMKDNSLAETRKESAGITPNKLIRRGAHALIKTFLQGPLCYEVGGQPAGTLKSLAHWCAARRGDLRLHFAKTGTMVTADPNATVDAWITGGLQFANGAAYSYVVLVGTGSSAEPWARSVHGAQMTPLLEVLLQDLAAHAKGNPAPYLLPPRPVASLAPATSPVHGQAGGAGTGSQSSVQRHPDNPDPLARALGR